MLDGVQPHLCIGNKKPPLEYNSISYRVASTLALKSPTGGSWVWCKATA